MNGIVVFLLLLSFLAVNKHPKASVVLSALAVVAATVNLII